MEHWDTPWHGRIECDRTVLIQESEPLNGKREALNWARREKSALVRQGADPSAIRCMAYQSKPYREPPPIEEWESYGD